MNDNNYDNDNNTFEQEIKLISIKFMTIDDLYIPRVCER